MFRRKSAIQIKTPDQVESMRQSGIVVARALAEVREATTTGVTTLELNAIADRVIRDAGAVPSFLGYHGFPAVICTSVNHQVVHGIPSDQVLQDGDVISVDCGAILHGWHADAAITIPVGDVDPNIVTLSRITEEAMWAGIDQLRPGGRLSDVGHAIERSVRAAGDYGIVRDFVGHGIGTEMHMEPPVPNYGAPGRGPQLQVGMTLAIEPMVTMGAEDVHVLEDDWTVVTVDGGWACHWEHTVAVTDDGPWVLTAPE